MNDTQPYCHAGLGMKDTQLCMAISLTASFPDPEFMSSAMSNMFEKPVDAMDIFKKAMAQDIELRAEEKRKREEADALQEAKTQVTIASNFGTAVQKGAARFRRNSLMKR